MPEATGIRTIGIDAVIVSKGQNRETPPQRQALIQGPEALGHRRSRGRGCGRDRGVRLRRRPLDGQHDHGLLRPAPARSASSMPRPARCAPPARPSSPGAAGCASVGCGPTVWVPATSRTTARTGRCVRATWSGMEVPVREVRVHDAEGVMGQRRRPAFLSLPRVSTELGAAGPRRGRRATMLTPTGSA